MAITRTEALKLSKCSINEQDKLLYDNNNLDVIDSKLKQLKDVSVKNKTATVKTLLELVGALDTSKATVIIDTVAQINPYFNQDITDILIENTIQFTELDTNHFGKLNAVVPLYTIKRISTNIGSVLDFNSEFYLSLEEDIELTNLTLKNLGYNNKAVEMLNTNIIIESCIFIDLQGSIIGTYKRYLDLDDKLIEYGLAPTTNLRNIFIMRFKDGISLFKSVQSIDDIIIVLDSTMELQSDILFETVYNASNIIISSESKVDYENISLCGGSIDFMMYDNTYKYEYKGLYNSNNITTVNCKLGSIANNNGVISTTIPQAEYKDSKYNIGNCYNIMLDLIYSGGMIFSSNSFTLQVEEGNEYTFIESCYAYNVNGKYDILDDYNFQSEIVKIQTDTTITKDIEIVLLETIREFTVTLPEKSEYTIYLKDISNNASVNNITVKLSNDKQRFRINDTLVSEIVIGTDNEVKNFMYDIMRDWWVVY